jgi:hypothetical protein
VLKLSSSYESTIIGSLASISIDSIPSSIKELSSISIDSIPSSIKELSSAALMELMHNKEIKIIKIRNKDFFIFNKIPPIP